MRAIFISYRRDDAAGEAGRLFDDLTAKFGPELVFMDVSGIQPGRDFRKVIDENVASCGVLLAVIGRDWLQAKNEHGARRLDDPSDFVRLETASALARDVVVIPVLVRGAAMPRADQLPEEMRELAYRNGVELTHARWGSDVELLVKALREHLGDRRAAGAAPAVASAAHALATPAAFASVKEIIRSRVAASPRLLLGAAAALLALAIGAYTLLGSSFAIRKVDTKEPLVANGRPYEVVVDFKARKHPVAQIEARWVRGDVAPNPTYNVFKVSADSNQLGHAPAGVLSYRSAKSMTATYQYVLIAEDGRRSEPFEKVFSIAPGPARPPTITMFGGPSTTRVGQPLQIHIGIESPDSDVVKIQERIVDPGGSPSPANIIPVEPPRRSGTIPFNWAASQVPLRVTAEFVLIDANGNHSEPRQRTFEVVGPPAFAQASDRARPPPNSTPPRPGSANGGGCVNCGTIVSVRLISQATNAATAGAAVGGMLGGLVDGQRRSSDGAGAAAGAIAGALVGSQQRLGSAPVYQVMVRYDDGRTQTINSGYGGWHNGDRVQFANGSLRYAP